MLKCDDGSSMTVQALYLRDDFRACGLGLKLARSSSQQPTGRDEAELQAH